MKTGAISATGAILAAVLGTGAWMAASRTGAPRASSVSGAKSGERSRVVAFWEVYQRATDEKLAGQWDLAERDYRSALTLNPSHWDSMYNLGSILMQQGRYPEARDVYIRLAAMDSAARAHSQLGAIYSTPAAGGLFNLQQAAREYQRARATNGDESGPVLRLGEIALAAGDTADAREYLQDAGQTDFKSAAAHFLLGYTFWETADGPNAATQFQQAIKLTKDQKPLVLGEGDTRLPGHRAMVTASRAELFDPIVAELWQSRDASAGRMESLFVATRRYIRSLPKAGKQQQSS